MSHNYATPLTPERRLARLMARIPDDWAIRIEKVADADGLLRWRAATGLPGVAPQWSAFHDTLPDALEAAWKAARVAPSGTS
ncbi:hypothetical protein [Gluconacetobacter tumulisoli]|uniref:Uncharacterized protein n=1 Tax=Gluconacetobacter tumulisoli TaxID=1286189 RepID=A0A7W4K7V4_9PROT|nr:hypothetical protein [Gluconacetobacter tumulisoli]MBB2202017.1 hypothetical protein [Gluconacetobacter tumulisoli]